jgi:MFS family permease
MTKKEIHQPHKAEPRLFYGYIVVIVAFLILLVSFGPYAAFGLFFNPLLEEFGWTRATTSGAFSLSMIIYGVLGIVVGGLTDRLGPRLVVTICGFLVGLGYVLMSQVNTLWHLYLFYGVIVGIGMSGVWVPQMSSIARWFVKRRSLMTGIVIAGAGISQLITPPIVSRLIAAYDWRPTYVIMGSVILVFMVFAAQFLRRDPAQMGLLPYGGDEGKQPGLQSATSDFSFKEAVKTSQFWLAFMLLFCSGFGFMAITVHIVPHAIDLGISAISAANILSLMGGVGILGNYVMGSVADRIGNRLVFMICFILMAADLFLLMSARELWIIYIFAVIFGFAFGGIGTVESPLVAGLFGLSSHGLIYGVVHVGFTVGASVGPLLAGYIYDLTLNYQAAFWSGAGVGFMGIILALILRPTKKQETRI